MSKTKSKPTEVAIGATGYLNAGLTVLAAETKKLLKKARDYKVDSTLTYEGAAVLTKSFIDVRRRLKALCDPEIKAAKADYDAKRKAFKSVDDEISKGEDALRDELEAYTASQKAAREAQVTKALTQGKDEKAASLAAKPFVPEVAGLSFTEHWHAEMVDFEAFARYCVEKGLYTLLSADIVALNAKARDLKSEDLGLPGVKGVKETSSTMRGA